MQSSDDNGALSISESNDDSPKMDNVKELVLFGGPLGINLKSCLGNQGAYIDSFYKTAYAGVNVGDLLCSINEKDVRTMRIEEIRWLIKNSKQPISLKFQSVFDYWPKNTAEGSNLPIETIKLILDQRFRSWTKRLLKEYALQQQSVDGTLPVTSSESNPTLMEKWKYFVLLHDSITTLSAFDHLECRSADVNAIKELLNFVTHLENKCNFVEDSDLEQMQKEELQFNKTGDDRSTFLEFRLQLEGIYKPLKMNLELELSQIPLSNVTCTKLMAYFYRQPQFHFISIDNILASNTCRIFLYLYLLALLPSNQSTIASTNANTGSNDIRSLLEKFHRLQEHDHQLQDAEDINFQRNENKACYLRIEIITDLLKLNCVSKFYESEIYAALVETIVHEYKTLNTYEVHLKNIDNHIQQCKQISIPDRHAMISPLHKVLADLIHKLSSCIPRHILVLQSPVTQNKIDHHEMDQNDAIFCVTVGGTNREVPLTKDTNLSFHPVEVTRFEMNLGEEKLYSNVDQIDYLEIKELVTKSTLRLFPQRIHQSAGSNSSIQQNVSLAIFNISSSAREGNNIAQPFFACSILVTPSQFSSNLGSNFPLTLLAPMSSESTFTQTPRIENTGETHKVSQQSSQLTDSSISNTVQSNHTELSPATASSTAASAASSTSVASAAFTSSIYNNLMANYTNTVSLLPQQLKNLQSKLQKNADGIEEIEMDEYKREYIDFYPSDPDNEQSVEAKIDQDNDDGDDDEEEDTFDLENFLTSTHNAVELPYLDGLEINNSTMEYIAPGSTAEVLILSSDSSCRRIENIFESLGSGCSTNHSGESNTQNCNFDLESATMFGVCILCKQPLFSSYIKIINQILPCMPSMDNLQENKGTWLKEFKNKFYSEYCSMYAIQPSIQKEMQFEAIFELFSSEDLINMFLSVLMECKIVIVYSEEWQSLLCSGVARWLIDCVQPLQFPFLYQPLLPKAMLDQLLHCPTPFIIGCHLDEWSEFTHQYPDVDSYPTVIIDLDEGSVDLYGSKSKFGQDEKDIKDMSSFFADTVHSSLYKRLQFLKYPHLSSLQEQFQLNMHLLNGVHPTNTSSGTKVPSHEETLPNIFAAVTQNVLKYCKKSQIMLGDHNRLALFNEEVFLSMQLDPANNKDDNLLLPLHSDENKKLFLQKLIRTQAFSTYAVISQK